MGKTSDLFKKSGDIKGTFHAKMGTVKYKNHKVLTETEELKKCKNTQKNNTEKVLMTWIIMMAYLSPRADMLECEVKWALGSIAMHKASGGDGIPADLFQKLKDDGGKVLHAI